MLSVQVLAIELWKCSQKLPKRRDTAKVFLKDFFSKCERNLKRLGIWSRFLKKALMENLILCAVIKQVHYLASIINEYL